MNTLFSTWFLGILFIANQVKGDCNYELGMQSGMIKDDRITASSSLNPNRAPFRARLDREGAWCSAPTDNTSFIQIELDEKKSITAIKTQGSLLETRWVTKFKIKYLAQRRWITYTKHDGNEIFDGNVASLSIKRNELQPSIRTHLIRIYPIESLGAMSDSSLNNVACLRLELYGCSVPASCPVLGTIKNGIITHVTLKGGGEVEINCHTNYTLVGSPKLICTNGRWNDSLPTCAVVCPDPGEPAHGRRLGDDYQDGRTVAFECNPNYSLMGNKTITCNGGVWNSKPPVCKAPCLYPGPLLHGRIIGDKLTHDSLIKFECLSGFSLKGSPAMRCNDGTWNTTKPTCTDCDGGKPLGMQSGEIPDSSIRASSQTDQHPAHHGRLGGKSFWCSKDEGRSFIDIDLPKEYKITAVSIEVQDIIKIAFGVYAVFFNTPTQFHAERPSKRPGERRIVLHQPMIAKNIRIVLLRPRRGTTSVCLRAEVYGCEIPRGCVMPGSAVLGLVGGIYWKGKLTKSQHDNFEFVYISGFRTLGKTDFVPDEIPDPDELSEGILVLVKDTNSDLFREAKIAQTGDPLYTVETNDGGSRLVNVGDIRVVKEPKFCPP